MKSQKKHDSSIAQTEREDDNVKNPSLENQKETNNAGNRTMPRKGKEKKEKENSGKSTR